MKHSSNILFFSVAILASLLIVLFAFHISSNQTHKPNTKEFATIPILTSSHAKNHLSSIVIAISYSNPFYSSIPLIKWLYQHFGKVYLCGDPQNGPLPDSVKSVPLTSGWHQHRCLLQAMKEYPDFKGYVGGNDDLILHPWVLATWNFDRCWIEKCKRFTPLFSPGLLRNDYVPGSLSVDHLGDVFEYGKKSLKRIHHLLPQSFKERLWKFTGGKDVYCEGDNDFIYIPQKHRLEFIEVGEIFDSGGVGFPWLYSASAFGICQQEIIHPNGVWLWGVQRKANLDLIYLESIPLIHPIKLSDTKSQERIQDLFGKRFQASFPNQSAVVFPTLPFIPPPVQPPCTFLGNPHSACPPAKD